MNDDRETPKRKPGEDDTLFDIDFLDDTTTHSGSRSKVTNSHANANYIPPSHVLPEETIDLDADDDNIENDVHENPFMSNNHDDQTSWNANRFDSDAYQPQSLRAVKPPVYLLGLVMVSKCLYVQTEERARKFRNESLQCGD